MQPVDLGIVALADKAALAHGKRRLVDERFADALRNVGKRVELAVQLVQPPALERRKLRLDLRDALNGIAQRGKVSPARRAVGDAADEPLHVADAGEREQQFLARNGILRQRLHRAEAALNGGDIAQRARQPRAQIARAHGGLRLVEHPEKAPALFLGADGLRQLEVAPRGEVKLHEAALLVVL